MLKRILKLSGLGISICLLGAAVLAPFMQDKDMTSISRPYEKTEYTYIDNLSVPLSGETSTAFDIEIAKAINAEREKINLESYDYNRSLGEAAYTRAEECETLFSHTRPDGSDWFTVNKNICFGENLAFGYDEPQEVVDAWLDSPTHKELVYDKDFKSCGIGHFEGADGTTYIACEFGY